METTYLHLTRKTIEEAVDYLKKDSTQSIAEKNALCILEEIISDLRKWESEAGE